MRKILLVIVAIITLTGIASYGANAGKTSDNLKAAYKEEITASARYTAYAEQAKKEGYPQIAIFFTAVAKSAAIHAANHKTVLERMGETAQEFQPELNTKTTKENLLSAIAGEVAAINSMYADFITTAKVENVLDAAKSMRWAMETEKKHLPMFKNAQDALNTNKVADLPKVYFVCPKCGNTYDVPNPEAECGFCGTKSAKFIKFEI
jgi:rubrerythrin